MCKLIIFFFQENFNLKFFFILSWNRSISLTNNLMAKSIVKTDQNKKSNTNGSINSKTDNELLVDLIPKSIDEEEIMLKKALELSLKYSEENKTKE
jgi:hypothetical protein